MSCSAIARLKTSRPQFMSSDMGCRNRAKDWRVPVLSQAMSPAQMMITVGVRQERVMNSNS